MKGFRVALLVVAFTFICICRTWGQTLPAAVLNVRNGDMVVMVARPWPDMTIRSRGEHPGH